MLKRISTFITWLIFSPKCILCLCETYEDNNLCPACWSKLSFISSNICNRCGTPKILENLSSDCICYYKKTHYSKVRSALLYDESVAQLIYNFKYHDKEYTKKTFAKWMLSAGGELIKDMEIIIPIPLHKKRLKMRKYNQAVVLARQISRQSKLKLLPDGLRRIKDTNSQSGLNKKQRKVNIRGAFTINIRWQAQIKNKRILLIDDVLTTGATANECARVLLNYGAKEVAVLTLAQTLES